jgi:hypothetical protein
LYVELEVKLPCRMSGLQSWWHNGAATRSVVHMKFAVPIGRLVAVLLCVAMAPEAAARELRHPARGTPAFTVQVPDDWTHEVDTDDNLIAVSQDRSTSVVVSFGTYTGSLEDVAKMMLQVAIATAPTGTTPASISGLSGFSLESTMKNGLLQLKLTIVRIGERGYGTAAKIEKVGNSPEQRQLADTVMQSVRIVGAPAPAGGRQ